jgi:hypothetical protein
MCLHGKMIRFNPRGKRSRVSYFQHMHIRSASFVSPKADERPDGTGWGSQNCTATGNLDKARRSGGNWRISRVMTARAIDNRRQDRFRRNEVA